MRTILNFSISAQDEASRDEGEWGRWGRALFFTVLIHVGMLAVALSGSSPAPRAPETPAEPELVFFSFPPPPAAARGTATSSPVVSERMPRQARTRLPRSPGMQRAPPPPTTAPAPVATEVPVRDAHDEGPSSDAVGVAMGTESVGTVVSGLLGGVLNGRAGGLPGATGDSALDLKQVSRPPEVLEQVRPRYPRRARAEGIEGLVLVRVIIGTDGRVEPEHTRVIRSIPALDAAALSAVSQWRFSPALGRQGRPVRVIIEVPIQFSLT
jgi:protein TonB